MKNIFILLLTVFILISATSVIVGASSDGSITVKVSDMPDFECYVDILVTDSLISHQGGMDTTGYDAAMIDELFLYSDFGWYPATVCGTVSDIKGSITSQKDKHGQDVFVFSGSELPQSFRLIVACANGETKSSGVLLYDGGDIEVDFNFVSAQSDIKQDSGSVYLAFVLVFVYTLLLSFAFLFIFKLNPKINFKAPLVISVLWTLFYVTVTNMIGMDTPDLQSMLLHLITGLVLIVSSVIAFVVFVRGRSKKKLAIIASILYTLDFAGCCLIIKIIA